MYVFNGNLESVEKFGFRILHFAHKMFGKVFIDNAIAGGKKGQYVGDKVPFTVIQVGSIAQIMAQINFFCCPEAGFGLLVKLPNIMVTDGENDESIFVFFQDGFFE